jgi:pimeloyl-ACP methyl ester carboxylesterase
VCNESDRPQAQQSQQPQQPRSAPRSLWADLGGPVHYIDYGGPPDRVGLLFLHGLGGSADSWAAIAPELARTCRVQAVDLAGFGLSRDKGRRASLPVNQELVHHFLTRIARPPTILVGHSMGGTIAIMQSSLRQETVAGLVLISPVIPWVRDALERRVNGVIMRKPRNEPEPTAPRFSLNSLTKYLTVARERGWGRPDPQLVIAGNSLARTLLQRRQFGELMSGIGVPVLWLHGQEDPLIPVKVARDTRLSKPAWTFREAPGVGHDPHRDAPEWTVEVISAWLGSTPHARGLASGPL